MRHGCAVVTALALAATTTGCGDTPIVSGGPVGSIEVSVEPNPVTAVVSEEPGMQWSATFNVRVRETAGIGGVIEFITVSPIQDDVVGMQGFYHGAHTVEAAAGTTRIGARGSLTIPLEVSYALSGGGRAASAEIHVHFFYDRAIGNVTGEAVVEIQ